MGASYTHIGICQACKPLGINTPTLYEWAGGQPALDWRPPYRAGQALIDPATPTEELARLTTSFLVPETPEEISGQVNNVVFVEGLVAYKGEWFLHYGQGDAGVGVLHGRSRTACG